VDGDGAVPDVVTAEAVTPEAVTSVAAADGFAGRLGDATAVALDVAAGLVVGEPVGLELGGVEAVGLGDAEGTAPDAAVAVGSADRVALGDGVAATQGAWAADGAVVGSASTSAVTQS